MYLNLLYFKNIKAIVIGRYKLNTNTNYSNWQYQRLNIIALLSFFYKKKKKKDKTQCLNKYILSNFYEEINKIMKNIKINKLYTKNLFLINNILLLNNIEEPLNRIFSIYKLNIVTYNSICIT